MLWVKVPVLMSLVCAIGCSNGRRGSQPVRESPASVTNLAPYPDPGGAHANVGQFDVDRLLFWSVEGPEDCGGISSNGLYAAPLLESACKVVVRYSGSDVNASATVRIVPRTDSPISSVSITPRAAFVEPGGSVVFSAVVAGTPKDVVWSVHQGVGGGDISQAGVYKAPSIAGTYHVVASSSADSRYFATARVIVGVGIPQGPPEPYLGLVLDAPRSWTPDLMYADIVKQARNFSAPGDPNTPAASNPEGWPLGDADMMVFETGSAVEGAYTVLTDGDTRGKVSIACPYPYQFTNESYDSVRNRTMGEFVVPRGTWGSRFVATFMFRGIPGGVRGFKVLQPGSSEGDLWNPAYLRRLKHFSTLRSLDWGAVNYSEVREWSDRTPPQHPNSRTLRGQAAGQPWEHLIDLGNRLGADLWVQIPYRATDDYVRKLAQLLKCGSSATGDPWINGEGGCRAGTPAYSPLDPNLKVYVEWSNEIWNFQFPAFAQNREQAHFDAAVEWVSDQTYGGDEYVARGASIYRCTYYSPNCSGVTPPESSPNWTLQGSRSVEDPNHLRWDSSTNQASWRYRHAAYKAVNASNIFRSVFGDASMISRIRPVIGVQTAGAENWGNDGLLYVERVWGLDNPYGNTPRRVNEIIYGLAGTTYVELDDSTGNTPITLDQYFAQLNANLMSTFAPMWMTVGKIARHYGVVPLAYEGSQHTFVQDGSEPKVALQVAAQYDSRMKDFHLAMWKEWFKVGNGLAVYSGAVYPFGRYGQWGFGEHCDREDEPGLNGPWAKRTSFSDPGGGTPKWAALKTFKAGTLPALTVGNAIPGTLNPSDAMRIGYPGQTAGSDRRIGPDTGTQRDASMSYWVRSVGGTYTISTAFSSSSGATVRLEVDGVPQALWSGNGPKSQIASLPAGLHSIRLKLISGTSATYGPIAVQ